MRSFLYMVGEESPWLQSLWVFRAPPLRASDASPQRPAFSFFELRKKKNALLDF